MNIWFPGSARVLVGLKQLHDHKEALPAANLWPGPGTKLTFAMYDALYPGQVGGSVWDENSFEQAKFVFKSPRARVLSLISQTFVVTRIF